MMFVKLLAEHGLDLIFGSTLLLGLGALFMRAHSRPVHVQRLGELSLFAALLFVVLGVVPMKRFGWELDPSTSPRATDALSPALRDMPVRRPAGVRFEWRRSLDARPDVFDALDVDREALDPGGPPGPLGALGAHVFMPGAATDPGFISSQALGHVVADAGDAHNPGPARGTARDVGALRSPVLAQVPAQVLPNTVGPQLSRVHSAEPAEGEAAPDDAVSVPADVAVARQQSSEVLLAGGGAGWPVDGSAAPAAGLAAPQGTQPVPTPVSSEPTQTTPLAEQLAWITLAGSTLAALYLLVGFLRLRRLLAAAYPAPAWVLRLVEGDVDAGGMPCVLVSPQRCGPFCVGVFRPTIVLPARLVRERSPALRHVLLHELAHARHGDGRGQLLAALALPVLWMHPLYWWVRRRVRFASELLADDQAAHSVPRTRYARELIGLVEDGWTAAPSPIASPTVLRSSSEFSRRIEMLLQRTDRLATRCSSTRSRVQSVVACLVLVVATGFFGSPAAQAQDAEEYDRLMVEKQDLQAQLAEMRQMMEVMREEMLSLRNTNEVHRRDASDAAVLEGQRALEAEVARELANEYDQERQVAKELALVQRAEAMHAAEQARMHAREVARREAYAHQLRAAEQALAAGDQQRANELLVRVDAARADQSAQGRAARHDAEADEYAQHQARYRQLAAARDPFVGQGGQPETRDNQVVYRSEATTLQDNTFELVSQMIDLEAGLELARLEVGRLAELAEQSLVSNYEVRQAEVSSMAQQRKFDLARSLLTAELRATEVQLSDLHKMYDPASLDRSQVMRLEARLELLAGAVGSRKAKGGSAR